MRDRTVGPLVYIAAGWTALWAFPVWMWFGLWGCLLLVIIVAGTLFGLWHADKEA